MMTGTTHATTTGPGAHAAVLRPGTLPSADEVAELLLVDVAVGRWMPGDEIDVPAAAAEHEVTEAVVRLALHDLRRAGLTSTNPFTGGSVIVWHRRHNEVLMRRLVGVVAVVAGRRPSLEDLPEPARAS